VTWSEIAWRDFFLTGMNFWVGQKATDFQYLRQIIQYLLAKGFLFLGVKWF